MAKKEQYKSFAVLGLGQFGMSVVRTLSESEADVMACDQDEIKLQRAAAYATHAVHADINDEEDLEKLGLGNFDVVILGIGEHFEAALIATMIAKEHGVKRIVAKAQNRRQKLILESMGVDEVILAEYESGAKLARRLTGSNVMDILEESEHYVIKEMRPMEEWVGKSIQQADVRRKQGMSILAIRREDRLIMPVGPDMFLREDDILITLSSH